MKAGIAFSHDPDAARAGQDAACRAVASSGAPVLTLLFTTDAYDPAAVLAAVREQIGSSKLVGFCCAGILTEEGVNLQGVGVCTLAGGFRAFTTLQKNLGGDPLEAGCRTGDAVVAAGFESGTAVVLPDGFQANLSEMLRGLYSRLGADFRYIGGGAGDNLKFFKTFQFTEQGVDSDAVATAVLDGAAISTAIGHGWTPMGHPMVMTKVRGKTVYEIDGIPAFEAYKKHLGEISREEFKTQGMLHPLGFPDVFGQYTIRDPLTVNDDGSIRFVTEVPTQAVGNVMEGQIDQLIETAEEAAREAAAGVAEPACILLFDCISRVLLMGDRFAEEIQAIRAAVGPELPLLGALTIGEIGAYEDVPLMHNKTTVVAVAGETKA
ncbi:MAG: histidine kinase [Lentisphaerae bacterium]|nr:histidine kinase [Lentisphaerota bacterium]